MRTYKPLLAMAIGVTLLAAACGSDKQSGSGATTTGAPAATTTTAAQETTTTAAAATTAAATTAAGATTTTAFVPPARGDADLVIWADDTRAPVLRPIAEAFGAAEGVKVSVLEVPFDKIRDNISKAGPAGEGPDVLIGANDWVGELVQNGAIAPIDLSSAASDYSKVAVQAFTWTDGKTYGLPYAVENIALLRNTDLVPTAPKTWEEVVKTALDLKAAGKVDVPLAIQQNPADPYHNFPLFTGSGGYLFKQNADGSYDPTDVGLDSPGGLQAATNFADWTKQGLISKDVSYDIMIKSFGEGKAPFAITGPWAVAQKDNGFTAMKTPFVVEPIPPLSNGTKPAVFVGSQGFMISAFSKKADLAKTFLLDYINKPEVQVELFKAGGRPPANNAAFDQVKSDPVIQGFQSASTTGQPLPSFPYMSSVFDTWKDAYTQIFTGGDPQAAFKAAATQIRQKVGG